MKAMLPVLESLATLVLAAFAGAMLLIGSAIGVYWLRLEPEAFRSAFQAMGPDLGHAMVPLMVGAIVLSGLTAFLVPERRKPWALACVLITLVVPLYALVHGPLNEGFLGQAPLDRATLAAMRSKWLFWHSLRTVAGFVALAAVTRR